MTVAVRMNSAAPPNAPRAFSAGALGELSLALHGSLAASNAHTLQHRKVAVARMCVEAHERGRGLKPMLAAVRAAWPVMPHANRNDLHQEQIALDRVLRQCLKAYYGG